MHLRYAKRSIQCPANSISQRNIKSSTLKFIKSITLNSYITMSPNTRKAAELSMTVKDTARAGADDSTPQHFRLYVTLFARAATSKTEPLYGPIL